MTNAVMNNVYNQFSTTYLSKKAVGRYDTHKRSELRTLCSSMAKVNRDAPIYLLDNTTDARKYVIHLKEDARDLRNAIVSTLGDVEDTAFSQKIAYSSNPNVVSARYIGSQSAFLPQEPEKETALEGDIASDRDDIVSANGQVPTYEIEVLSLASPQINLGMYVPSEERALEPGKYSFDINVNDMGYEFQFSINESDTNLDIQKRLCRLINNSKIGLNAELRTDGESLSALRIESVKSGIESGQNERIFSISDNNTEHLSGAVAYFGLDYTVKDAANASFIVNGTQTSAASNHFILQNDYEITLNGISENEGQTTTIGVKPDVEALQENISNLIGGYNHFIHSVSEYKNTQLGSNFLIKEMNRITGYYQQEIEKLGIKTDQDGTLSIDTKQLQQSVVSSDAPDTLSSLDALKSFSHSMLRKSSQISLNPVSYMNKTVVAYKNPGNYFLSPYVTSAYSGMFFNNYC